VTDPLDRIYEQLLHELYDVQGHRRGHFAVTDTEPFRQLAALMSDITHEP